jgi:adenylate cyclase
LERFKAYILERFEAVFVLLTLLGTALINFYLPQKIAFLNFYFLPIILGGYYLGQKKAMLGALLCVLIVTLYVFISPEAFHTDNSWIDIALKVTTWGSFLILAGAVVGKLQEKLTQEIIAGKGLNEELQRNQDELKQANAALHDYSANLEERVRERTNELEQSRETMESLKAKVEEALYATMDSSVVKLMIEGRLRNEKRNISILFSDLVGFTAYSEELPPEVVIRDLNRYLSDMEPILLTYRGHIDKYMGDGIMCEFGAPLDFETYPLLAVLAGLKMQEKVSQLNYPWKMRIGIASGSAIIGLIGSKRQTYTAIGNVVNLASRLEKACGPGQVLIGRATYDAVSRYIETRKIRDLPAKEISDAKQEHELESLHQRLTTDAANPDVLFQIGRVHMVLNELQEAFDYFERALKLDPRNTAIKVAYAEAGMKLKETERITVKGQRHRIEAYEVTGLTDPFKNRDKIPQHFYEDYQPTIEHSPIPEDVVLPVEALDGSIGHSKVVAVISFALADVLKLSENEKQDVLQAGFLADVGKQIAPYHLLNRKGGLSAGEFDLVRMHPIEGSKILRTMGYDNESLINIVLHSHENFNGTGHPDGLRKEDIPIGSRIVAVADAYDALTSWRPYREPWERHAALDEIRRGTEKGIYDPKVVEMLAKLMA